MVRFRAPGRVTPVGTGWQVAETASGEPVILSLAPHPTGADRVFSIGDAAPILVETLVLAWLQAELEKHVFGAPPPEGVPYRTTEGDVRAAFDAAAALVGTRPMPAPPSAASTDPSALLAYLRAEVRPSFRESLGPDVEARFGEWLDALDYQPRPALADFADVFPEHELAKRWRSLDEGPPMVRDPETGHVAGHDATTLYVDPETGRIVELRSDENAPWIVADYPSSSAFLREGVLGPHVREAARELLDAALVALRTAA